MTLKMQKGRKKGNVKLRLLKAKKRKFIFWDIETKNEIKDHNTKFKFLQACTGYTRLNPKKDKNIVDYKFHRSELELAKYFVKMIQKHRSIIAMAHNTGFDLLHSNLLPYLEDSGFKYKIFNPRTSSFIIKMTRDNYAITFLDSMNWFPFSLDKLGDMIGDKKLEIDFDKYDQGNMDVYNKQDVTIVKRAYEKYVKWYNEISGLSSGYTRGSDAYQLWKISKKAGNVSRHANLEILRNEYNSYRGGRTECFKLGALSNEPWYKIDINSLYPYVMANNEYSTKYIGTFDNPSYDLFEAIYKDHNVLCDISFDTKIPIVPIRDNLGMYYPIGRIRGWYCGNELNDIIDLADVIKIHKVHAYNKSEIFRDIIEKLYEYKKQYSKENRDIERYNVKLMLNSIYGKFGQKMENLHKIGESKNRHYNYSQCLGDLRNDYDGIMNCGYDVYGVNKNIIGNNSCPIIASEVSGNGRAFITDFINRIGIENIAYCDTDSLILNQCGFDFMSDHIDNIQLGSWKLEGVSNKVVIRGLKDYSFGSENHTKGIPKKAKPINKDTFQYTHFTTFKEGFLHRQNFPSDIKQIKKKIKRQYWKKILCESSCNHNWNFEGGSTPPIDPNIGFKG